MAEYICREALLKAMSYHNYYPKGKHFLKGIETAEEIIEHFHAADVQPVVRCKDCKHRPIEEYGGIHGPVIGMNGCGYADFTCPYLCGDLCYSRMPKDDWFCNFGEKKG